MKDKKAAEVDYTLTIIERDGKHIVCEGGQEISLPFDTKSEAEDWSCFHARWYQPRCCGCGGRDTRPDDPWDHYSVSCSTGPDWMHRSCLEKLLEQEINT